jgi:hypothetical protein
MVGARNRMVSDPVLRCRGGGSTPQRSRNPREEVEVPQENYLLYAVP